MTLLAHVRVQIAANVTLARDKVTENDERKEFGFDPKKNLPNPKGHAELPNLHPDEHSFMNCRPPVAVGNPSNRHNMTFGDNRIAGTYSNKTYYRDTFRGPRPPCKILGEGNLTDIYRTPEERKNAYERALLRIGKQKVSANRF